LTLTDEGFLRPEPEVLAESSLVPAENLIQPPPRFSHEVVRETPFSWAGGAHVDGELPAGAPVLLLREGDGGRCWVVDSQGLYVSVPSASLRPLPS
jgi:hypothetical protein